MKVLVTGARGMLAQAVVPVLAEHGFQVLALDREQLDVTDDHAVHDVLQAERPGAVVQCAAYTAVDRAETEEPLAFRVNAEGTQNVARACQKTGAILVYPSTDYVFDGAGTRPYTPSEDTAPINAYGRTKRAGELAALQAGHALVVRTSWLYGRGGPNFVDTILNLARERDELQVVSDQIGRPTWTVTLSEIIAALLICRAAGTFHVSGGGPPVSWFEFAREILAQSSLDVPLRPVATSVYRRAAQRPAYSVLDLAETETVLGQPLPDWRESLSRYLGSRVP